MSRSNADWVLENVSPEARLAAANAAKAAGMSLGDWLTQLVHEFGGSDDDNKAHPELSDEKLSSIERAMLRARANNGK